MTGFTVRAALFLLLFNVVMLFIVPFRTRRVVCDRIFRDLNDGVACGDPHRRRRQEKERDRMRKQQRARILMGVMIMAILFGSLAGCSGKTPEETKSPPCRMTPKRSTTQTW